MPHRPARRPAAARSWSRRGSCSPGDVVTVSASGIGELTNPVVAGHGAHAHVTASQIAAPMSSREGHVALVTGAGTGIGAATARLLADRGMDLALAGRRRELLEETARAVEAAGRRALVLPGDLAHAALPKQLVEETVQALGRLDVLVNNAATIAVGPLGEFTLEHIDRHLAVNTRAPLLLTQEATRPSAILLTALLSTSRRRSAASSSRATACTG